MQESQQHPSRQRSRTFEEDPRDTKEALRERRELAEVRKLELEVSQLERRQDRAVLSRRILLEGVVAGLVAAGLLAAWLIAYLLPILSAKSELARIKSDIYQERSEALKAKQQQLSVERDALEAERNALQQRAGMLKQLLERGILEMNSALELAKSSNAERSRLLAVAREAQAQIAALEDEIGSSSGAEAGLLLQGYKVTIRCEPGETPVAEEMRNALERAGVQVDIDRDAPPYHWAKQLLVPRGEDPRVVQQLVGILGRFEIKETPEEILEGPGWSLVFP